MSETFNTTFGAGESAVGVYVAPILPPPIGTGSFTGTNVAGGAASISINGTIDRPGSTVAVDANLVGLVGAGLTGTYLGFSTPAGSTESTYYFSVIGPGIPVAVNVAVTKNSTPTLSVLTSVNASNVTAPDSPSIVCFVTGTLIRTARGDVAVETLAVGDIAVTASGAHRPIRWIGSRTVECARHVRPAEVLPVRIAAGAFGENRPARDLLVSPGHSIAFDVLGEVLIPASSLINGATVTQLDVETVTYWHVQLDSHDILLANGQPAESYIDMGNRSFFGDGNVVEFDGVPDADAAKRTFADYCRPFHSGGAVVDAVRAQIQARAERLGWYRGESPWADMHLMVDGARIDADTHGLTARFVVPASATDVWLISQTSVPFDASNNMDQRRLGLCLSAITIDDGFGDKRTVALDDPLLRHGFHKCEEGARRWTAGRSELPAALFEGCRGTVFLRFDLVRHALPRWMAPEAAVASEVVREAPLLSLVAA